MHLRERGSGVPFFIIGTIITNPHDGLLAGHITYESSRYFHSNQSLNLNIIYHSVYNPHILYPT